MSRRAAPKANSTAVRQHEGTLMSRRAAPKANSTAVRQHEGTLMSAGLAAKPLAGTRILDMSTVMLGPYATQMPGDYGADIVKIESPGGDSTRATHAVEVTYAASATCYFCATLGPVIGADFLGPQ